MLRKVSNYLMMMMVIVGNIAFAQESENSKITNTFNDYKIIEIDAASIYNSTSRHDFFNVSIDNPFEENATWDLELFDSNIISDNYLSRYAVDGEIIEKRGTTALPTHGIVVGDLGSSVNLTFNEGFIMGSIKQGEEEYFIEPLSFFEEESSKNSFIVYKKSDLKPERKATCASDELDNHIHHTHEHVEEREAKVMVGDCYEIDYAIANDYDMYQAYGSVAATENHAISITNLIQGNYDDEFADEILFLIVEQYTATSNGSDPWTNSNDAGTLLDDFVDWGGFDSPHDIGSLWTDRNLAGSTVGIAYVGAVCTGVRYNVLMNFTNNSNSKRVMVAHELGHNFGSYHDAAGSGYIMAPSVNNTDTWSNQSIDAIEDHYLSRWCLATCVGSGGEPPVADFEHTVLEPCVVGEVEFENTSTGSNLTYEWTFEGGIPNTSTQESPVVIYDEAGTYSVTLVATNNLGEDEIIKTNLVTIYNPPVLDFEVIISGSTVSIVNNSLYTTFQEFNFGDGTISNDFEPIHEYEDDGVYTIIMYAENACGNFVIEEEITISTVPFASFETSNASGCTPHTINFNNLSSDNSDSYNWVFEGGTPATSTDFAPTVTYNTAGTYDVSLTVSNAQGTDVFLAEDYVTITAVRNAAFDYEFITSYTVQFTDVEDDGLGDYQWNFGDGNFSNEQNPTHTYNDDGDYTVTFTKGSDCGDAIETGLVSITAAPLALFTHTGDGEGCAPYTVSYNDASLNDPDTYLWTFEGGTPATSTDPNPDVVYYTPGVYGVTLEVSNEVGSNIYSEENTIVVLAMPDGEINYNSTGTVVDFLSSYDSNYEYNWDFGNGESATGFNPSMDYESEGIYDVAVTITNACGSVEENLTIDLYTAVEADFSTSASEVCPGEVITYTSMASANVTEYNWVFEGGTPSTSNEENPVVTYSATGIYDVRLEVSNPSYGDVLIMDDAVTVLDMPTASFASAVEGGVLDLVNMSTDATSYLWDFGDGESSTEVNPVHSYSDQGTYTVTLTATNECGVDEFSTEVYNYFGLSADFSANLTEGCIPFTLTLSEEAAGAPTDYLWIISGPEEFTSNEANPTFELTQAGVYDVSLTVSNALLESTEVKSGYITLYDVPSSNFTFSRDYLTVAFATNIQNADSYTWDFGDGNTSMELNPTHTYEEPGTYVVTLVTSNECGENSSMVTIGADSAPFASFTSDVVSGCAPLTVMFENKSTNADSYAWVFEGGVPATSTALNPTVVYNEPGSYKVSLTSTNGEGSSEIVEEDYITVYEAPEEDFSIEITDNTLVTTYLGEGTDLSWNFGDGSETSSGDKVDHVYSNSGDYEVVLTGINICGPFTVTKTIRILSTAVEELGKDQFLIYPNPASHFVNMQSTYLKSGKYEVNLYNVLGQKVKEIKGDDGSVFEDEVKIDLQSIEAGLYIITVEGDNYKVKDRLIIL